ncbi:unnamed protein product, partial [Chrysoparadoxa australica]
VEELRKILLEEIAACGPIECIILSGGLDTSIIADAGAEKLGLKTAVTVLCGPEGVPTDEPYAKAIAESHGFKHHILRYDDPRDLVAPDEGGLLERLITCLGTFDPMEIRNSICVARAIEECRDHGITSIVTGDGADELFAGYSFYRTMDEEKLLRYISRLQEDMCFSAVPLAAALGGGSQPITVAQPFLGSEVRKFALTCKKSELVLPEDEEGEEHGKYALRLAFPEASSRWRRKDPIEV